jgi:hypothetical protein
MNGSLVASKYKLIKSSHQDPLSFSKYRSLVDSFGDSLSCPAKEPAFEHFDYSNRVHLVPHKVKRIDYVYKAFLAGGC